ncbi:MAG: ATP synthase F0 subunit B, partial [Thermodesulfobacteriota bacterium]
MGWKIFNFIILVIGIYLVWTKMIKGMLDQRGVDIKVAMEDAAKLKESAEAKEKEYNEKLKMLDEKIASIQNELKVEGHAEKERIVKEAALAAVKIKEQAKLIVEQEVQKAKEEIKKEVAWLAVDLAEDILKKELNPEDQQRLVKGYLDKVRLN